MQRRARLRLIAVAAALTISAAPAAASGATPSDRGDVAATPVAGYTMLLPDGIPVRAARPPAGSFMDYTDDA
jgi:hypothetical protein